MILISFVISLFSFQLKAGGAGSIVLRMCLQGNSGGMIVTLQTLSAVINVQTWNILQVASGSSKRKVLTYASQ